MTNHSTIDRISSDYDRPVGIFRMERCREKEYDQASEQQKLLDEISRTELRADHLERSDLELEQDIASLEFAVKEQMAERKVIHEGNERTNVSFFPPVANLSGHWRYDFRNISTYLVLGVRTRSAHFRRFASTSCSTSFDCVKVILKKLYYVIYRSNLNDLKEVSRG